MDDMRPFVVILAHICATMVNGDEHMSAYTVPQANVVYTVNNYFDEVVAKCGPGGVFLAEERLSDGSVKGQTLTASEAALRPDLAEVLQAYEDMKSDLLGKKDSSLKPGVIVAFPSEMLPPPKISSDLPIVKNGRFMGTKKGWSEDDAFLVYQPSSNLVWKPLAKLKAGVRPDGSGSGVAV